MIAFVFFGLLAFASAAPHFQHHRHRELFTNFSPPQGRHSWHDNFRDGIFETDSFWKDLADEMHQIDEMLFDFKKHFASSASSQGIEGNEYIIAITLNGFDEKDIVVKAREGLLMIQAVHKCEGGNQRNYMDLRNLPSYVNVAGSWTYDKGILKVVFPLTTKSEGTTEIIVTDKPTVEENKSREEIDKDDSPVTEDADVGIVERFGDKETELDTNVIPRGDKNSVEATTYAVDLKNEVEFVPMKY